jgi:hypothetical protein
MPLLHGRYRALSKIAVGTFSQLIQAEDTLSTTREIVAIKVMKSDYATIGIQVRYSVFLVKFNFAWKGF